MDIQIKTDNDNKFMQRREIEFYVVSDGPTPSTKEVSEELCKKLNLNPDHTVITRMDQRFGVKQLTGYAHYYEDADSMKKYEPAHILERMKKRLQSQPKEGSESAEEAEEPAGNAAEEPENVQEAEQDSGAKEEDNKENE